MKVLKIRKGPEGLHCSHTWEHWPRSWYGDGGSTTANPSERRQVGHLTGASQWHSDYLSRFKEGVNSLGRTPFEGFEPGTDAHSSDHNLKLFKAHPDDFFARLMDSFGIMDEHCVHYSHLETKEQSKRCKYPPSTTPMKAKVTPSAINIMASIFWDFEGLLLVGYPKLSSPSLESPTPIIWSVCAITSSRWGQKCWPKRFCSMRSTLLPTTWWWRLKNTWRWVPVRSKPASLAGTSPLRLQPLSIPVKDMTRKRYGTDDDVTFRTKHVKLKSMGKYNKRCSLQDGYAEHVQTCHILHRQNFIVPSLRFLCEAQNFSATPRKNWLPYLPEGEYIFTLRRIRPSTCDEGQAGHLQTWGGV